MKRRFWTEAEEAVMRARYANEPTAVIALELKRSDRSVYAKADLMGLSKSAEYLARPESGRLMPGSRRGSKTSFKKGNSPWNTGKQGWQAGGRSKETQFKPGNRPRTWLPIGSERVVDGGVLQRKVTDTRYPPRDWVAIHKLVWVEANGPVPKGHIVVFKNGDRTDVRIENLECITRGENMRRNSYHTRYPKEVAQLIQLRGAVNRQINKRASR